METIGSAIAWTRSHWDEQSTPPIRLHVHEVSPDDVLGSPKMSSGFWRHLQGDAHAVSSVREEVPCPLRAEPDCARCGGLGYTIVERFSYRWPMTTALARLAKARPKLASPIYPHPYRLVIALASNGWNVGRAAAAIGRPASSPDEYATLEAVFLSALRQLHGRYASAPLPSPSWVDKSDAQRSAEDAA